MWFRKRLYFREQFGPLAKFYPSLRRYVCDTPQPDEARILNYLMSGREEITITGPNFPDALNPVHGEDIGSSITWMTDGVWVWQDSLIYYVEEYHIRLPRSFVD